MPSIQREYVSLFSFQDYKLLQFFSLNDRLFASAHLYTADASYWSDSWSASIEISLYILVLSP